MINITINQTGWLSLADFQRAMAFQTRDQIKAAAKRNNGTPRSRDNCVNMSAMSYLRKSVI